MYNLLKNKLLESFHLYHSLESLQFLDKFHLQNSDLIDLEYTQICESLVANEDCYVKHGTVVGKTSTPFWIRLQLEAKLQPQRFTTDPIEDREKLNTLMVYLQNRWNNKSNLPMSSKKLFMGLVF